LEENVGKILGVIVTYNAGMEIIENAKQVKKNVDELLIVDNGSGPETKKHLKSLENVQGISINYLTENMGIAYALNTAFHCSEDNNYQWVLTMDQDSRISEGMVQNMLGAYNELSQEEKEKVAILVPSYCEERFYNKQDLVEADVPYTKVLTEITSGNLVKTDIFKSIGYLKDEFFIDYVDHEFCLRINRMGYEILKINNAFMLHNLGNKTDNSMGKIKMFSSNHSPVRRYYMTRNRLWVWKEYLKIYPQWVKEDRFKFIREIIKIILFEESKFCKIKMITEGIESYKKNIFGAYNIENKR